MSTPSNDGGPAFPATPKRIEHTADMPIGDSTQKVLTGSFHMEEQPGMSLLDYFAAAALTGIYANSNPDFIEALRVEAFENHDTKVENTMAREAYKAAHAMIRFRAKK